MPKRVVGLCLLPVLTCWLSAHAQGTVTLLSPSDGAISISTQPEFTWNPTGGARSYDIQISDRSDMRATLVYENVDGTSFSLSNPLDSGETYFWRVRGRRTGPPGRWSDVWSFTTAG